MKTLIKERYTMLCNNELPDGYKSSDYGPIPVEWDLKKLADLIEEGYIVDHSDGNHGSLYPRRDEFVDEGVPYISANTIVNGKIDFKMSKYLKKERANQIKKGVAQNNDVLFAHNASVGPVALLETNEAKVILSTTLTYYRCNEEQILPKYLMQYMQSRYFCVQYERIMAQSTRNQVPITTQRELYHIVPPISEQQKIATILSTWDKAIEFKEQLIEQKKKHKRGLMKKLLTGELRLPGFNGEWKEVRLGEVLKERNESRFNDLELLAITSKKGVVKRTEVEIKDNSNEDKSKYKRICPLDIGYNTMRMWQGVSGVSEYEGIVSPAYTILKPTVKVDSYFIGYLFQMPKVINLFWRNSQGLVDDTLNLKYSNLKIIKVKISVDIKEQKAISEVFKTLDHSIELMNKELEVVKLQKKGLMQLLLTGIIRVEC